MFETAVNGQQDLKAGGFRRIQKIAVLETSQTRVLRRLDVMLREVVAQALIHTLIEQNPHSGLRSEKLTGLFEYGDRHLARNRGKTFEKLLDRLACL